MVKGYKIGRFPFELKTTTIKPIFFCCSELYTPLELQHPLEIYIIVVIA